MTAGPLLERDEPLDSLRRYDLSRWFIGVIRSRLAKVDRPMGSPPNASGTIICARASLKSAASSAGARTDSGLTPGKGG